MTKDMMKQIKHSLVKRLFCKHEWELDSEINTITSVYGGYVCRVCKKCGKIERL